MIDDQLGRPGGHVFISYVREDTERVDRLSRELERSGIRVWRDTADLWPGQDWKIEIRRAIDGESLAFLACFSSHSEFRARSYQNEELILAVDRMRLQPPGTPWLIPVRFDDCRVPPHDLGNNRTLDNLQRVDLFDGDWPELGRLISAVTTILSGRPKFRSATTQAVSQAGDEWVRRAASALEGGQPLSALTLAERGLSSDPLNADLQYLRAKSLLRLNRRGEAVDPLRLAHERDPGNEAIARDFVSLLLDLGEYAAAYEVWPEIAKTAYMRHLICGGIAEARIAYELWSDDPWVRRRLADLLLHDGSRAAVQEAWSKASDEPEVEARYIELLLSPPLDVASVRELSRIFSSLSAEARMLAEKATVNQLRDLTRVFPGPPTGQSSPPASWQVSTNFSYERVNQLRCMLDAVEALPFGSDSVRKLREVRGRLYQAGDDALILVAVLGAVLLVVLIGLMISGLFFVRWATAVPWALIIGAIGLVTALSFLRPSELRARRERCDPSRIAAERVAGRSRRGPSAAG